jgi:ABC-type polar amino acid transport system ATPase subunit
MSLIPMNQANIQLMVQNDAQQLRTMIAWVEQRYQSYNQNCTTANMTTATIATADQNSILAFIGDLNRLKTLMNGTLPSDATNMKFDCAAVLGIL